MSDDPIRTAAIQYDGLIFTMPQPARHAHVMRGMHAIGLMKDVAGPDLLRDQGFTTSLGRYVSREEGARIARAAGQLEGRVKTGGENTLYSEDLW